MDPLELPFLLLESCLLFVFTLALIVLVLWMLLLLLSGVVSATLLPWLTEETADEIAALMSYVVWMPVAKIYHQHMEWEYPVYMPPMENPLVKFRPWLPLMRQLMFVLVVLGPKTMLTMSLGLACFSVRRLIFLQQILQREVTCTILLGTFLYMFPHFRLLDVVLCLTYSALSNVNLLTFLLSSSRHPGSQWLQDLREDYLLGTVVVVDLTAWLLLFIMSFSQQQVLASVAAAINVLLGLLNVLGPFKWPLLGQQTMPPTQYSAIQTIGARRATRQELLHNNDVCPVCLRRMHSARVTPCGHFLHGHCLRKSMIISNSCPVCRSTAKKGK